MNPLTLLDDLIPAKARKEVHAALMLAALIVTIWFTADGDWKKALAALAATIYTASNTANTKPPVEDGPAD